MSEIATISVSFANYRIYQLIRTFLSVSNLLTLLSVSKLLRLLSVSNLLTLSSVSNLLTQIKKLYYKPACVCFLSLLCCDLSIFQLPCFSLELTRVCLVHNSNNYTHDNINRSSRYQNCKKHFWKVFSLRNAAKKQAILGRTLFLTFATKLLPYVDIQLSFLENINKSLTNFSLI